MRLELENEAKTKYFEWVHEIAVAGSINTLPRTYLNLDQKKKLEIFYTEKLYHQHKEMLLKERFGFKVCEDLYMSKVFSILASNSYDTCLQTGLLKGKPEVVKKLGGDKYALSTAQICELYNMHKTPTM